MLTPLEREYIVNLALKLQGIPYIWGGTSPRIGFDCSGFVIWILQVFDILPSGDWRASELAQRFTQTGTPQAGDLAFYGHTEVISHVMMYLGAGLVIGASGGDSSTTTEDEAKKRGAKVKIKPWDYRSDFQFYVDIGVTSNA